MVHPAAGVIVEVYENPHRRVLWDVAGIFPTTHQLPALVSVQYQEVEAVQMKGMIHSDDVLDRPDLGRAQTAMRIDAVHVHLLAIDHSLRHDDYPPRGDVRGVRRENPAEDGRKIRRRNRRLV